MSQAVLTRIELWVLSFFSSLELVENLSLLLLCQFFTIDSGIFGLDRSESLGIFFLFSGSFLHARVLL
jgi:hypothetical protein